MALVVGAAPYPPAYRGSVPPVPKAPAHASTTPFGFEGGQIFATDEPTVIHERQENQHIRGQVSEFAIAPLVGFPTLLDPRFVLAHSFLPQGKMSMQANRLLISCSNRLFDQQGRAIPARFEPINFPAQPRLSAINAPSIQKDRTAHLAVRLVIFPPIHHPHRYE